MGPPESTVAQCGSAPPGVQKTSAFVQADESRSASREPNDRRVRGRLKRNLHYNCHSHEWIHGCGESVRGHFSRYRPNLHLDPHRRDARAFGNLRSLVLGIRGNLHCHRDWDQRHFIAVRNCHLHYPGLYCNR